MFKPSQFIKCPYTSKPLRIVHVVSCESLNGADYEGWYNLHVVDSEGNTDLILHTPNNPMQIISNHQSSDIQSLQQYALSRGFNSVSATFDSYLKYSNQLTPYYTLEADSMRFSGTYDSIMNELSNTPKGACYL